MKVLVCSHMVYDPCIPTDTVVPIAMYRRLLEAAIVVCVENEYDRECYAFDNLAEAEQFYQENKDKDVAIYRGEKAKELIKEYISPKSEEEAIENILWWVRSRMPKTPKPEKNVAIFLVDASGSMEPAWYEAWDALFNMARRQDTAFVMLAFKDANRIRPSEETGVVTRGSYHAIIDIARLLQERNLVRIKRAPRPEEVGLRFEGWTPLLAAIADAIAVARRNYPDANITMYVVSDNRDSLVARNEEYRRHYSDSTVIHTKRQHRVRLVLIPVGHYLRRYTEKYDEVMGQEPASANNILSLI